MYRGGKPCPFCEIVAGVGPAEVVDRGDEWMAFRPLHPVTDDHTLFIPTRHVESATADPETAGVVMAAAAEWLRVAHAGVGNLITSSGAAATQTVFHLHVHAVPRGPGDGLRRSWPWLRRAEREINVDWS